MTSKQVLPIKKVKMLCHLNIGMSGVYPEALAWNVGAVHSDFKLGERMWRSGPQRANQIWPAHVKVHLKRFPS